MHELVRRYGLPITGAMTGIVAVWVLVLIVLPYFFMVELSFKPNLLPDQVGGPLDHYTLTNYVTLFGNTIHFGIFVRTIWASALVTLLCLVVCYPVAYYLAQLAPLAQVPLFLLLLIIPFWINEILRTFAWYIILSYSGPLNTLLKTLGLISRPIRFQSTSAAPIIGMIYAYILFMMFPLYNALQTLDHNQVEAARDLGAGTVRIHRRVVIPHAKPGIAVGCIMVFMLAAGSYAVPLILGSVSSRWFTEIIYQWFFEGQNWPQGSAYAFLLLLLCLVFILVMMRLFKVGVADIAK